MVFDVKCGVVDFIPTHSGWTNFVLVELQKVHSGKVLELTFDTVDAAKRVRMNLFYGLKKQECKYVLAQRGVKIYVKRLESSSVFGGSVESMEEMGKDSIKSLDKSRERNVWNKKLDDG